MVRRFPVPLCREFPRYLQGFRGVLAPDSAQESPKPRKFPVLSLLIREIGWARTRALELYDEAKVVARQIDLLGLRLRDHVGLDRGLDELDRRQLG